MKAMMMLSLIVMVGVTGCSNKPVEEASIVPPPSPLPSQSTGNAPVWEIGEDIAGKTVMIDGKQEVIPDDVADVKRKMDAAAKETLDDMDALEKQRNERFKDPDMTP
ncbi:MAG: hypothetical protein ABI858_10060 [Pseudoxanthomonas sp.]